MGSSYEKLSRQRQIFVREYVTDMNATRAALEAGYSKKRAQVKGSELTRVPDVKNAIDELLAPAMREADLTRDNILAQLSNFLFSNIVKYLDEDGGLRVPPDQLPEHVQQCIVHYEVEEPKYDRKGNQVAGRRVKVKLPDKVQCLQLAMRYLNLLNPETVSNNSTVLVSENAIKQYWESIHLRGSKDPDMVIEGKLKELESEHDNP